MRKEMRYTYDLNTNGCLILRASVQGDRDYPGLLGWSGSEAMFDALEGVEHTRAVTPYIEVFERSGI
jgi:hypothetical protein